MHSSDERAAQPRIDSKETVDWRQNDRHYDRCPSCKGFKLRRKTRCGGCTHPRSPERSDIIRINEKPCRYLPLTKGQYAIVDAHLYDTLMQWKWTASSSNRKLPNGDTVFYVRRVRAKGVIQLHRYIVETCAYAVDHANGNTLDFRLDNLRPCNQSQNLNNKRTWKPTKSGYRGVYWHAHSQRFHVSFKHQKKTISFGYFKSAREAARVYNTEAVRLNGEFAILNHISD